MYQLKMDDCSQRYLLAKVILEGMCTICYQKTGLASPPSLQLCARRCSPTPKNNSSPLKFFLNIVITRTEPRLDVNF
jgi:hypothetical protein